MKVAEIQKGKKTVTSGGRGRKGKTTYDAKDIDKEALDIAQKELDLAQNTLVATQMKAGLPQYMLASGGKTGSAAGGVVKPQVTKSMTSEEKFLKDQERKEKESIAYHALHNPDGSKKKKAAKK